MAPSCAGSESMPPEVDGDEVDPIAICGLSIKFPQEATSAENFWEILVNRRCVMTEFPTNRLNPAGFHSSSTRGRINTVSCSFSFTTPSIMYEELISIVSFQQGVGTSLKRIFLPLMRTSSISLLPKRQRWILCRDGFWREHTGLSKTV